MLPGLFTEIQVSILGTARRTVLARGWLLDVKTPAQPRDQIACWIR